MVHHINVLDLKEQIPYIHAKDEVYLSGTIYTARDAAHKKLRELINDGKSLPIELDGAVIYYAGPTPERPDGVIGACGPTTASRMDEYVPLMMDNGMLGMIGKGPRNESVVEAIKEHGGIYFCAIGGAGALCAKAIKSYEVVAFSELGCESVKKMQVENFPLICGIDKYGKSIFEKGK